MANILEFIMNNAALSLMVLGGLLDLIVRNIPTEKRKSLIMVFTAIMQVIDTFLDKLLGQNLKK